MTHPPAGPSSPPPPPGPKRQPETPLDPDSPNGRAVAARLTKTLAAIELEIAERKAAEAVRGAA